MMFLLDLGWCDSLNGYKADVQLFFSGMMYLNIISKAMIVDILHCGVFQCVVLKVLEQQKHQAEDKMMALEQVASMDMLTQALYNPDNPDRPNLFALFWSQILQREDAEREDFGKQNLQFYCMPYSEFCIVCQEQKILVWLGRSTRRSWDVWLRFRAEALWDVFWCLIPISYKYWR